MGQSKDKDSGLSLGHYFNLSEHKTASDEITYL